MITLCIDTSYKYLTCLLMKDDEIISSYSEECFKRQSEKIFDVLDEVFKKANLKRDDIDSVCISKGPGSYTGVRISMTLAKTLCALKKIDLYTISTFRLYAGNKPNTMVLMDARASRAYIGIYDKDKVILNDCVKELKDISTDGYDVVLDGHLLGLEDKDVNIPECFKETKKYWEKVDNVNHLTPTYLKESEDYYR